jgi:xylulokinase
MLFWRQRMEPKDPSKKFILAIDMGTSGPKVALVSALGEVLDWEIENTDLVLFPGGGAEQDPEDWWQGIIKAAQRLLSKRLVPVDDIVAVSASTQWSGTVAVDQRGEPLMNAIIWMDTRGAPYVDRIVDGALKIEGYSLPKLLTWVRLTGGIPGHAGKDPIAHILYIKHQRPDKFLEPKDYINLRLTGKYAASYDSICLHWVTDNRDISKVVYSPRLLQLSQVEREKLPDLLRAVDLLGPLKPEVAELLGLKKDLPVVVGTPDVQSAAVGSGAVEDFECHLYIGTSSWLACHVPYKKSDLTHNMAALPSAIPNRYLLTNEQECAGMCLTYLKDNLFFPDDLLGSPTPPEDPYAVLDSIVEDTPPGSGKLIFTPWLYGERAPVDDPLVRGGFFNQSLNTTREELIRAVFEGVAYNARWLLKYVEKFIDHPIQVINMVGGGARSEIWCQIHADVLNRTIRQVKNPMRTNARGAAFLASFALGYLTFEDIPKHIQIAKTYLPNPDNRKVYDQLSEEFVNIYQRNKGIYARLNRIR